MTDSEIDELRIKGGYVGGRAEISDVRAHKLVAELSFPPGENFGLTYDLEPAVATSYDAGDSQFVIEVEYDLEIQQLTRAIDDGASPDPGDFVNLAKVSVTLAGLFVMDLDEDDRRPDTEEVEAYARSTGLFALHPYAREHIANLTTRIGLPTLTVGVLRMHTGQVSDDS